MNKIKEYFDYIKSFVKESYIELKKVTWLSRKEAVASTTVIVILIFLTALYVGVVDFILSLIIKSLIGGRI